MKLLYSLGILYRRISASTEVAEG